MHGIKINHSNWKPVTQAPKEIICWLKLDNGDIVLAVHQFNGLNMTGWFAVWASKAEWVASTTEMYSVKDAMYQTAKCEKQ